MRPQKFINRRKAMSETRELLKSARNYVEAVATSGKVGSVFAKNLLVEIDEYLKKPLYEEPLASRRHLSNEEIKQIPINAVGDKNINNFVGFPRGTLGAYLSGWRDAESYHGIKEQE
jgi:hypothetical protein